MNTISAADTGWILTSSALVLLMTPGLAFFYGGLVRGQSVLNTMMMKESHTGGRADDPTVVEILLLFRRLSFSPDDDLLTT